MAKAASLGDTMSMGIGQKKLLGICLGALLLGLPVLYSRVISAQDLQAELDALDELPEDDLEGFSPAEEGEPMSNSSSTSSSENAQTQNQEAPPPASAMDDEGEASTSARELGVGDLDLQGLEQELNFDSFQDGGKLSINQLNEAPEQSLGDGVKGLVTGLDFKQLSDRVRLVVKSNRPINWTRELRARRRQVIVEIRNMDLSREILKRALDTGEFEGPVAYIQAFPAKVGDGDSVKVLFQLRSFVDPTILSTGNDLVIDFPIVGGDTLFRSKSATRIIIPKTYLSANDIREFVGAPINLNVKQADLGDILKFLSAKSGKNFVLSEGVGSDKKVTVGLNGVPWDQALAIILFNQGLGYQDLENVYRVATIAELQKEIDVAKQAFDKAKTLVPIETRLVPLSYTRGDDVTANIKDFLTERGKASVDKRSNTLVITDIPEVLEKVDRYVRSIDKQTPQVRIEARIVEASEGFSRSKGFVWSAGTNPKLNFGVDASDSETEVVGGSSSLTWANLGGFQSVLAILRLAETKSQARTIASPSVTVLANETANINQGVQVKTETIDTKNNTITTQFVPITTGLQVTPQVTSDGFVVLNVDLKRDIQEDPDGPIGTRSVNTKLIVESGKTAVLGGLYTLDKTQSESGLPWLQDVPIFGKLFQNSKSTVEKTNELLMFIAPTIINRGLSQVTGGSELNNSGFSAEVDASAR